MNNYRKLLGYSKLSILATRPQTRTRMRQMTRDVTPGPSAIIIGIIITQNLMVMDINYHKRKAHYKCSVIITAYVFIYN